MSALWVPRRVHNHWPAHRLGPRAQKFHYFSFLGAGRHVSGAAMYMSCQGIRLIQTTLLIFLVLPDEGSITTLNAEEILMAW